MKTLFFTVLACAILTAPCYSFVVPIEFAEKCKRSDAIIRGIVVDIVTLAGEVTDSHGREETVLEGDWSGPTSVAVIRVVSVIKGDTKEINSIIFVPCGYNFDESPCELTETKDYILFLEDMGRNFFHPLGPFCMHRIQKDIVSLSGFDWDGDFDPKVENREAAPIDEFLKRIANATAE